MHRLKHGTHLRFEDGQWVTHEAGAQFEPTEAELAAFGERLEAVEEPAPEGKFIAGMGDVTDGEPFGNLLPMDLSIETAAALVAAGIDTLEKLTAALLVEGNLEKTKGIGKKRAAEIRALLMADGLPAADEQQEEG